MASGRFLFSLVSVALGVALVQSANAAIIITTNMGGADAEVRESEQQADLGGVPIGSNRGTNSELATRVATNRSSAMYMKFDIGDLTPADLAGKNVRLRMHVRNNNLSGSRLTSYNTTNPGPPAGSPQNQIRMEFAVRGLDPNMVDGVGNPNNHNADQVYDWDESVLTWFKAPGITPDDPDGTGGGQILGDYNFNSDAPELGTYHWPIVKPQNHLASGSPIDYVDHNGNLKQLVLDAMAAGKDSVTLIVHHNMPPDTAITPGSFLNFNYLVIPKDVTIMNYSGGNDTTYDNDTTDMVAGTGSPYSCLHSTICPGSDVGMNPNGEFSPKLIIWVPEPSSLLLVALGSLASLALVRRRRK